MPTLAGGSSITEAPPRASWPVAAVTTAPDQSREALVELLSLAAAYRGWTTRQLATALDRCTGNLVPDSGMPKLDLVVRLADALEWPLETVISQLVFPGRSDRLPASSPEGAATERSGDRARALGATHLARQQAVHEALRSGDSTHALRLAEDARLLAGDLQERAEASLLEADAFESRGRWARAIAAIQRALSLELNSSHATGEQEDGASSADSAVRPLLLMRLARAYHRAGLAIEGRAVASEAIDACRGGDQATLLVRAEALLLRGLCARDQLETRRVPPRRAAESALADLDEAMALFAWPGLHARRPDAGSQRHLAAGAQLELRAALGRVGGGVALAAVLETLGSVVDVEQVPDRAWLEACGWWCVFGFGIASRQPAGVARHQMLAVLSNKAEEIAGRVDCWALRERVLRLEFERRELIASEFGESDEWLLDIDDLRMIVGCIGASPRFRDIGLGILRRATVAEERPPEPRRAR